MNFICNICNSQYVTEKDDDDRYHCPGCGDYSSTSSFVNIYSANPNIEIAYQKINYYYIPICYKDNMYMIRGNNRARVYEKPNTSILTCPAKEFPTDLFNGRNVYQGSYFVPNMEQAVQDIIGYTERLLNLLIFS